MNSVSKNIFFSIALYLSGPDLTKCLRVCKTWKERILSSTILKEKMVLDSSITLGECQWRILGHVEKIPKLPDNIKEILEKECSYFPEQKRYQTGKLLLIVKEIAGQALSLSHLSEIAKNVSEDKNSLFWRNFELTIDEKRTVERSYWLWIPKKFIPETCNKNVRKQKKYLKDGDRLLTELEATAFLVLNYISSGNKKEILFQEEGTQLYSYTVSEGFSRDLKKQTVLVGHAKTLGIHLTPYTRYNQSVGMTAAKELPS